MYVTTTSVMKQMNTLEERLGLKLIERSNQGIRLTEAGKVIYRYGCKFVKEEEQAIEYAGKKDRTEVRIIRVGSSFLNPADVLIRLWEQINYTKIDYRFNIVPYDDNSSEITRIVSLLGKEMDLIIGADDSNEWNKYSQNLILGSYRLCVAVPKYHALSQKDLIRPRDLYGEELMILPSDTSPILSSFKKELREKHPEIKLVSTNKYYDMEPFNECASGKALLLSLDAWRNVHPSLVTIPLECDCRMECGIRYSKNPTPEVQEFIEVIRDNLSILDLSSAI